jgi:uncharacterized membrane protein required for colicin V production
MVFSILIFIVIAVIAFFHYVQGFFSATLSAMIAVVAAVLALSYDETVVNLLLKGKMADEAHGMVLCMIFAVVYIVLRVIFDAAIPGNVRTPSGVDKGGAILMGLVAGVFVTGIFTIAVQMLPWDPTISFLGYTRYKVVDKKSAVVPINGGSKQLDSFIYNELQGSALTPETQNSSLLLPVDDWVLDTVYHLSDGGSLAGDKSLASVHPDYLTELFGERLGIQTGYKRTTINLNNDPGADVTAVFMVNALTCFDGQIKELRQPDYKPLYKLDPADKNVKDSVSKGLVQPTGDQRLLVVRVKFKGIDADDEDNVIRFSTGAIHLVGKGNDGKYKDFFPIGTLYNGSAVLLNKPDDFLFAKQDGGVDLVFVVDEKLVTGAKNDIKLADGVSISIKRFADLNLSDMPVDPSLTSDPSSDLIRNKLLTDRIKAYAPEAAPVASSGGQTASPAPSAGGGQSSTPSANSAQTSVAPTNTSPAVTAPQPAPGKEIAEDITAFTGTGFRAPGLTAISTTAADPDAKDAPVAGGTISLKEGKIIAAKVDPTKTLTDLNSADNSYNQFAAPAGFVMVQVAVHPYQAGWDWIGQTSNIALIDSNGNKYPASGYYQLARTGGATGLLMRYDIAQQHPAINSPDGTPASDTYYIFLVPTNTDLKAFTMGGKTQDLSAPLHAQ